MDMPHTPEDTLKPAFARLRAAYLAQIPDRAARLAALRRLETAILRHRDDIVAACTADFGRRAPIETLSAEVLLTLDEIRHARRHLKAWMRPQRRLVNLTALPARARIHVAPLGVVGIIAAWNYPFMLAMAPLANALAAGNRVMVKPSEMAPATSVVIAMILSEVFTPDEVVVVQGDAVISAAFTRLPFDHLLFTGSTRVGRLVMAAAAPNLTPVTLELGGKSPTLIAPDYSIAQAADRIAFGKGFNGGQTCVAPDYVLLPRAQRDAFVAAYLQSLTRRYPGVLDNPDCTAIIDARQADRLREYLTQARDRGVEIVQYTPEGDRASDSLELIAPTLLLDPPDDLRVMCEEIFGPLLPIKCYDNYDEAIAYILARDKPLALYLFDHDSARIERTVGRVSAGNVCVNDVLIQFGQHNLPVGGVGASGMGHYHGHAGFLTFSKSMPVLYQSRWNAMRLFDPPYTALAKRIVDFLTR